jgi:hypothetical protein
MHAPCLYAELHQRPSVATREDLPARDRAQSAPFGRNLHLGPRLEKEIAKRALICERRAVRHCQIRLFDMIVTLEVAAQCKIGAPVLCENHYAARVEVKAMDNAVMAFSANAAHLGKLAQKKIYHRRA